MKTTLPTNKALLEAFAAGAHGPFSCNSLAINMGGELQSYGTPIIRRDVRTRSFQVLPGRRSSTTNKQITQAKRILLAEGWKELT